MYILYQNCQSTSTQKQSTPGVFSRVRTPAPITKPLRKRHMPASLCLGGTGWGCPQNGLRLPFCFYGWFIKENILYGEIV